MAAVIRAMKPHTRSIAQAIILGSSTGCLLLTYLWYSETGTPPAFGLTQTWLVSFTLGGAAGLGIRVVNHVLNARLPWKTGFALRFLMGFLLYLAVGLGTILLGNFLLQVATVHTKVWAELTNTDGDLQWKLLILLTGVSFIYSILNSLLSSYRQFAVTQIATVQQERKQLELQFEALKSQLSPHYLFNSLNTISSLLYTDPQTAEQFIRRLAQTYQYILSTQHKKCVTLKDELDFVESYYYLLRIRFQQLLNVEVSVPKSLYATPIPPLTLQLLVENAVKHNTISRDNPLSIFISSIDNKKLKVVNTRQVSAEQAPSFQVGLENIRKRYAFFSTEPVEVRTDKQFTVLLPVLQPVENTRTAWTA